MATNSTINTESSAYISSPTTTTGVPTEHKNENKKPTTKFVQSLLSNYEFKASTTAMPIGLVSSKTPDQRTVQHTTPHGQLRHRTSNATLAWKSVYKKQKLSNKKTNSRILMIKKFLKRLRKKQPTTARNSTDLVILTNRTDSKGMNGTLDKLYLQSFNPIDTGQSVSFTVAGRISSGSASNKWKTKINPMIKNFIKNVMNKSMSYSNNFQGMYKTTVNTQKVPVNTVDTSSISPLVNTPDTVKQPKLPVDVLHNIANHNSFLTNTNTTEKSNQSTVSMNLTPSIDFQDYNITGGQFPETSESSVVVKHMYASPNKSSYIHGINQMAPSDIQQVPQTPFQSAKVLVQQNVNITQKANQEMGEAGNAGGQPISVKDSTIDTKIMIAVIKKLLGNILKLKSVDGQNFDATSAFVDHLDRNVTNLDVPVSSAFLQSDDKQAIQTRRLQANLGLAVIGCVEVVVCLLSIFLAWKRKSKGVEPYYDTGHITSLVSVLQRIHHL